VFSRVINAPQRTQRPRGRPVRILLITASPQHLSRFDLTSIDVDLQRRLVQSAIGLAGQPVDIQRLGPKVTLDDIRHAEKDGFHITHLVAHAMSEDGRGYVLLCNSGGSAQQVSCEEITSALVPPSNPPALVYIATPTEGGDHDFPTRLGLGRALLEAGVQAAVVIQAPIESEALALFTERFYSVLIQTGAVDLAMAAARVSIYTAESWAWAYPVLMIRTDAGELWTQDLDAFETIVRGIKLDKA
jgi:CHAT domain